MYNRFAMIAPKHILVIMMPALPPQVERYVRKLESSDPEALVAVFDRDGFYLYASPNHTAAFGYTAAELTTMHLSQIVDKSYHHAAWVLRTVSALYANPIRFSTRMVTKSGEVVQIGGTVRRLSQAERELFFVTCTWLMK